MDRDELRAALEPDNYERAYRKLKRELKDLKQAIGKALDACEIDHDHRKAARYLKVAIGEDPVWKNRQGEDSPRRPFREREYTWGVAETPPSCPECGRAMGRRADGPVADWYCDHGHPAIVLQEPEDPGGPQG